MSDRSEKPSRGTGKNSLDWFEGVDNCSGCGKRLTLDNFGVARTVYPSRRREVLCEECVQARVDENVQTERERLGYAQDS